MRKPKDKTVRQVAIHISDFQKLLQMLQWRGYDNRSEMVREAMSIAQQYYKTQVERGHDMWDEFYSIGFSADAEFDENLAWMMKVKKFKKETGAIRTAIRLAYQVLENYYGKPDELPMPQRKKKSGRQPKKKE